MRRACFLVVLAGVSGGCALNPQPEDPHDGTLASGAAVPGGAGGNSSKGPAAGADFGGSGVVLNPGSGAAGTLPSYGTGNVPGSGNAANAGTGNQGTGNTTSTGNAGNLGTGNAGAAAGGAGSPGSAGAAAGLPCGGVQSLPMSSSGRIDLSSNPWGIQGSWGWAVDNKGSTVTNATPGNAPFDTKGAMCLKGTTVADNTAWGAWLGFDLNATTGAAPVQASYSFTGNNLKAVKFHISGNPGGHNLRVVLSNSVLYGNNSPYTELAAPISGCHSVTIADAKQASSVANPVKVDPSQVYQLQFQLVGGTAGSFDFCIDQVSFE